MALTRQFTDPMTSAGSAPARRIGGTKVSPTNWRSVARVVEPSKRLRAAGSGRHRDVERYGRREPRRPGMGPGQPPLPAPRHTRVG